MQDFGTKGLDNLLVGVVALLELVVMAGLGVSLLGGLDRGLPDFTSAANWVFVGIMVYVTYRLIDVVLKMLLAIAQANERSARALEYIAGRKAK